MTDLTGNNSYIAAETESDASDGELAETRESNRGEFESGVIVGGDLDDERSPEIRPASNFGEEDEEGRPEQNGGRQEMDPGCVSADEIAKTNEDAPQYRGSPLNLIYLRH